MPIAEESLGGEGSNALVPQSELRRPDREITRKGRPKTQHPTAPRSSERHQIANLWIYTRCGPVITSLCKSRSRDWRRYDANPKGNLNEERSQSAGPKSELWKPEGRYAHPCAGERASVRLTGTHTGLSDVAE